MKKRNLLGVLVMLLVLVLGAALTGCKEDDPYDSTVKYTIYTATFGGYNANSSIGAIDLNGYAAKEISTASFEYEVAGNYKNVTPNQWAKAEIVAYLTGLGLSADQAEKVFKFICDHDHVHFGVRTSTQTKTLLK